MVIAKPRLGVELGVGRAGSLRSARHSTKLRQYPNRLLRAIVGECVACADT